MSQRETDPTLLTERERSRAEEDRDYVPVIVKRTDQARRHPDDVLHTAIEAGLEQLTRAAIEAGLEQLTRAPFSLALSAVGAGLTVGFTAMAVGVVNAVTPAEAPLLVERLLIALVYPLGFVVCLMSGTELFTEHTATAVYPVLDKKAGAWRMLRLWLVVGAGNFIGTLGIAFLLTVADEVVGAREGYIEIGRHLVEFGTLPLLASALLAGWLMALGAWLILSTPAGAAQLASIYIVTFLIGLGGLHHSIAGSAEMFTAYFISDQFTLAQSLRFVGLAMLGNLVGGSLFVAGLNYAHIRHSQAAE
jgi:formate/nitrite transporter FocA (FNT family)